MGSPSLGVTFPIWIDKIRARIAESQAGKRAAEARLDAGQIEIAARLAGMLTLYRESVRDGDLLGEQLLPRARQSLEAARAGYASGRTRFLDVIAGARQVLGFELALIEARTRRELALASLSLQVAGVPPTGSPAQAPAGDPPGKDTKESAK
jgi:outer membrane protein TolC